jgi:sterol 14-demethylase
MSFATYLNGTVPVSDAWSGYLVHAQEHLKQNSRLAIIAFLVNVPIFAIVLNVIQQVVIHPSTFISSRSAKVIE